jgi:hypothetical protein
LYAASAGPILRRFRANLAGLRKGKPNHEFVAGLEGTGKSYYLHKLREIAHAEKFLGMVLTADLSVTPHQQVATILGKLIDEVDKERSDPKEPPRRELRADWDAGVSSKLFDPKNALAHDSRSGMLPDACAGCAVAGARRGRNPVSHRR